MASSGKTSFPFEAVNQPLTTAAEYFLNRLEREPRNSATKPQNFWFFAIGLLASSRSTYGAICTLVAGRRPKPFVTEAHVLLRVMLEALANLLALCEAPAERARIYERHGYREHALRYTWHRERYSGDPKWSAWLSKYEQFLRKLREVVPVTSSEITDPDSIKDYWPTPGKMLGRRGRGFLSGNRLELLGEFYDRWYGVQSALAHQSVTAVGMALSARLGSPGLEPGEAESNVVADAQVILTCFLSEVEAEAGYEKNSGLREVWTYLRQMDDEVERIWNLRYRDLLDR